MKFPIALGLAILLMPLPALSETGHVYANVIALTDQGNGYLTGVLTKNEYVIIDRE